MPGWQQELGDPRASRALAGRNLGRDSETGPPVQLLPHLLTWPAADPNADVTGRFGTVAGESQTVQFDNKYSWYRNGLMI